MTKLFNDMRKRYEIERKVTAEPQYKIFNLEDNGNLTFKYKDEVIDLGNINRGLISPSSIRELGANRLRSIGFRNILYNLVNIRMIPERRLEN